MSGSARFAIAAAGGIVALALAGTAFGAYDPELLVVQTNRGLGGSTNVVVDLNLGDGHVDEVEATSVTTLYAPRGYGVKLGHPVGSRLGWLNALVWNASARTHESVDGTVVTDDPANHLTNSCAPGRHEAVWVLGFTAAGNRFRVPVYVDRVTTGPEVAYASARMVFCLASPYFRRRRARPQEPSSGSRTSSSPTSSRTRAGPARTRGTPSSPRTRGTPQHRIRRPPSRARRG